MKSFLANHSFSTIYFSHRCPDHCHFLILIAFLIQSSTVIPNTHLSIPTWTILSFHSGVLVKSLMHNIKKKRSNLLKPFALSTMADSPSIWNHFYLNIQTPAPSYSSSAPIVDSAWFKFILFAAGHAHVWFSWWLLWENQSSTFF